MSPCKYCGAETGQDKHTCWPTYCLERLGRDCSKCSNNCLFMRGKVVPKPIAEVPVVAVAKPAEPIKLEMMQGKITVERKKL